MQTEFELAQHQKELEFAHHKAGKTRDKEKLRKTDAKHFALRGASGNWDKLHGQERIAAMEKAARKVRIENANNPGSRPKFANFVSFEGQSKAFRKAWLDIYGRPKKVTQKMEKPEVAFNLKAAVARFKRVGDLPTGISVDDIKKLPASNLDGRDLARMIRAMLLKSGIEPNPGPLHIKRKRAPESTYTLHDQSTCPYQGTDLRGRKVGRLEAYVCPHCDAVLQGPFLQGVGTHPVYQMNLNGGDFETEHKQERDTSCHDMECQGDGGCRYWSGDGDMCEYCGHDRSLHGMEPLAVEKPIVEPPVGEQKPPVRINKPQGKPVAIPKKPASRPEPDQPGRPVSRPEFVQPEDDAATLRGFLVDRELQARVLSRISGVECRECDVTVKKITIPYTGENRLCANRNVPELDKPMDAVDFSARLPIPRLSQQVATLICSFCFSIVIVPFIIHRIGLLPYPDSTAWKVTYAVSSCCALLTIILAFKGRTRTVHVSYIPHLVSSLVLEYDRGCNATSVKSTIRMRSRRLAALPIPDRDALQLISGSEVVAEEIIASEPFFWVEATCFRLPL